MTLNKKLLTAVTASTLIIAISPAKSQRLGCDCVGLAFCTAAACMVEGVAALCFSDEGRLAAVEMCKDRAMRDCDWEKDKLCECRPTVPAELEDRCRSANDLPSLKSKFGAEYEKIIEQITEQYNARYGQYKKR